MAYGLRCYIKDYTGMKFGKWIVIKKIYIKNRRQCYLLRCECGNERIKSSAHIKRSSRCLKCHNTFYNPLISVSKRKGYGYSSTKTILTGYKIGAIRRKKEWSLTDQETLNLMAGNCHYCGRKPYREYNGGSNYGGFLYNGIDRIDNEKGYTISNCRSCCPQCNFAKHKMSESQFLNMVELVYNYRIKGNDQRCEYITKESQKTEQVELSLPLQ